MSSQLGRIQDFPPPTGGGGRGPVLGGHGPPMWALFGENVCENERIGFRRGGGRAPENFICRFANSQCQILNHLDVMTYLLDSLDASNS